MTTVDVFTTATEMATIGALLTAGCDVQASILAATAPTDFADPRCGFVRHVVGVMVAAGVPVDVLTFHAYVLRHGVAAYGWAPRWPHMGSDLMQWVKDCPVPASGEWYASQVVELAARRRVVAAGAVLTAAVAGDLDELRALARRELEGVLAALDRAAGTHPAVTVGVAA